MRVVGQRDTAVDRNFAQRARLRAESLARSFILAATVVLRSAPRWEDAVPRRPSITKRGNRIEKSGLGKGGDANGDAGNRPINEGVPHSHWSTGSIPESGLHLSTGWRRSGSDTWINWDLSCQRVHLYRLEASS